MLAIQARTTREVRSGARAAHRRPPGTPIQPAASLDDSLSVDATQALAALLEQARQQRPERAALAKRMLAASERVTAAGAGSKPTIAVGGGFDYARPNPRIFPREGIWQQSWDASVNLRWPLFDGGRTRAETAEASANSRASGERLAEFDAGLAVELRQRGSEIESSRAAIEAAGDAVRSATEARRVVGDGLRRRGHGIDVSTRRSRFCRRSSTGRKRSRMRASPGRGSNGRSGSRGG
jgi:outer membrane protein TolC